MSQHQSLVLLKPCIHIKDCIKYNNAYQHKAILTNNIWLELGNKKCLKFTTYKTAKTIPNHDLLQRTDYETKEKSYKDGEHTRNLISNCTINFKFSHCNRFLVRQWMTRHWFVPKPIHKQINTTQRGSKFWVKNKTSEIIKRGKQKAKLTNSPFIYLSINIS